MANFSYNTPIIQSTLKTVYTVRHGQSIGNALGMDDDSLKDLANHQFPLTEKGKNQLALSGEYIRENNLLSGTGIYTSNFLRAQQSLEIILEKQNGNFSVTIDPRLDEWWRGIFHALSKEEIEKNYTMEKFVQAREGKYHYRPSQGQSGKDVEINLLSFLNSVTEENIFIVGHGRSFGFLHRILTNQPINLDGKSPNPKNGEIWKFNRNGKYFEFESLFVPQV